MRKKVDILSFFRFSICSIALIFIIFYGGFGTNLGAAKPVAVHSVLLSTLGVVLTAVFTGLFCHFVLKFQILDSFLIGAVIGSTDAASVFSILRSKKLLNQQIKNMYHFLSNKNIFEIHNHYTNLELIQ